MLRESQIIGMLHVLVILINRIDWLINIINYMTISKLCVTNIYKLINTLYVEYFLAKSLGSWKILDVIMSKFSCFFYQTLVNQKFGL